MGEAKYLVTGSMGCIGSWVLYHLVQQGKSVVSFDISPDLHRLNLLLDKIEQNDIVFEQGDITRLEAIENSIKRHQITHIIHLGALQVPFCRENPIIGAEVNVIGTLNIFEAARRRGIGHLVYASSIAVYGNADEYQPGLIPADAPLNPHTLYGGFKQCNEQNARMYASDYGVSSTALRPYIVYGVGRDQGMTSDPTKAMLAAVSGKPYEIGFGGTAQYQLASDVALQFLHASIHPLEGAHVYNIGGDTVNMTDILTIIKEIVPDAEISFKDRLLPFPAGFDDSALRQAFPEIFTSSIREGIHQTMAHFTYLLEKGYPV